MIKIFFIIIFLWIIYQINKFVSGIQRTNIRNRNKNKTDSKSQMDIQDAEYEELDEGG